MRHIRRHRQRTPTSHRLLYSALTFSDFCTLTTLVDPNLCAVSDLSFFYHGIVWKCQVLGREILAFRVRDSREQNRRLPFSCLMFSFHCLIIFDKARRLLTSGFKPILTCVTSYLRSRWLQPAAATRPTSTVMQKTIVMQLRPQIM
jgi:hypothetical protein